LAHAIVAQACWFQLSLVSFLGLQSLVFACNHGTMRHLRRHISTFSRRHQWQLDMSATVVFRGVRATATTTTTTSITTSSSAL
jgi:hypothetical protein